VSSGAADGTGGAGPSRPDQAAAGLADGTGGREVGGVRGRELTTVAATDDACRAIAGFAGKSPTTFQGR
jgi:hypothetical protein